MADSLKKIIRLSARLQMPVVIYNLHSEEAAVVMDVDVFEKREAEMARGCCVEDSEEDIFENELPVERDFSPEEANDIEPEEREFRENMAAYEDQKAQFENERDAVQAAHALYNPKFRLSWEQAAADQEKEELQYEPTGEKALFPAFTPQDEEESDEEPIFFEEPV